MRRAGDDPFALRGALVDGKYRVESAVGEGAFGVVYRAEHEGFGAPVAIKCLKLPPHFGLEAQERLVRGLRDEGRLLLKLSQRTSSIVQALDVGVLTTSDGARVPYLVLEWLEGRTLGADLDRRVAAGEPGRTLAEAIALLSPAAKALAIAHQEKIAHRDVKPDNLFLVGGDDSPNSPASSGGPSIKILDFGIAKVFADEPAPSGERTHGVSAFTPAYGAPEQFDRELGVSGPWTDVYAFALVLVEVVAQRRALGGDDLPRLYAATTDRSKRPTLAAVGAPSSPAVERVLGKALSVDPEARYPHLNAFWDELEAAAREASSATAASPTLLGGDSTDALDDTLPADPEAVGAPSQSKPTPAPLANIAKTEPSQRGGGASALRVGGAIFAVAAAIALVASRSLDGPTLRPSPPAVSLGVPMPSASSATESPEARKEYELGLAAFRDGDRKRAVEALERATRADRGFAAAHLRLALWQLDGAAPKAREALTAARAARARLGELDAKLLSASASLFAQPWDLVAWTRALDQLVAERPTDAELLFYWGDALVRRLDFDGAVALLDRALVVDPELVPARLARGDALGMKGDAEGQAATYRACVAKVAAAVSCEERLILTLARAGHCSEMLVEAKQHVAAHGDLASAYWHLADALASTRAAREAVLEAVDQGKERLPAAERAPKELELRASLATLGGDFQAADVALGEWMTLVSSRTDQYAHAVPTLERARLYVEIGQDDKAGKVAEAFLRRMDAWTEPFGGDLTISFLPFARLGRQISEEEFQSRRDAWLVHIRDKWVAAGRQTGNDFDWISWSNAYGSALQSKADAELAVAKMPGRQPRALAAGRWQLMDYNLGRALALAGRAGDAQAPISRAAKSCAGLADPTISVRAWLELGEVLEAGGDRDGARAAYQRVIDAWGHATPASVSAKEARRRLAALP